MPDRTLTLLTEDQRKRLGVRMCVDPLLQRGSGENLLCGNCGSVVAALGPNAQLGGIVLICSCGAENAT